MSAAPRALVTGFVAVLAFAPASGRAQGSVHAGDSGSVRARAVAVVPPLIVRLPLPATSNRDLGTTRPATVAGAQVRGRVLDAGAEVPLAAASLRIEGNGEARAARSSMDGAFSFTEVPPGTYALIVARPAYRSTRLGIVVPSGGALVVDVQLTRLPVALQRVYVDASRPDSVAPGTATVAAATLADGQRAPRPVDLLAAQGGTLSALAGEATSRRPGDPGSDRDGRTLYIWGAKDAGARVMLDGITLGAPLHLGGLLPVVDDDLMSTPHLWTGGSSPRHDGGTDYVLDLSTRPAAPDSVRAWATADLLTARLGGEMPLGRNGSILVGARHVDENSLARAAGVEPGYRYGDLLTRVQLSPATGQVLRATGFATREGIGIPRDQGQDDASWANGAASVSWERIDGSSRSLVRAGISRASIDLPLLTLTDGHLRADADRATLLAERRWSAPRQETSVGVEWERLQVQRSVAGDSLGTTNPLPTSASACPVNQRCLPSGVVAAIAGQTAALYIDHRRALAPRLRLMAGLRSSVAPTISGSGREIVLPRLALEALPFDGTTMRVSLGKYSRIATFFDGGSGADTDPPLGSAILPADPRAWMSRATATQVELGGTQRWRHTLAGVVAFWSRPGVNPVGQVRSQHHGIDASWRFEHRGTSLQASYSRVVRSFAPAAEDTSSVPTTARRVEQLASVQGAAHLGRVTGNVSASYAHGLSFASVVLERPASESKNRVADSPLAASGANRSLSPTQDAYLRVDATISAKWCVGGAGCRFLLTPYARLLNALDRRDAIFYYSDAPGHATNRLAGIPALLSLGMRIDVARAVR